MWEGGSARQEFHPVFYKRTSGDILDIMNLLGGRNVVCKICLTKVKYFGNTVNKRNHISHFTLSEHLQSSKQLVQLISQEWRRLCQLVCRESRFWCLSHSSVLKHIFNGHYITCMSCFCHVYAPRWGNRHWCWEDAAFFIHLQQKSHLLAWLQELAFSSRNQVTVKSLSNPVT